MPPLTQAQGCIRHDSNAQDRNGRACSGQNGSGHLWRIRAPARALRTWLVVLGVAGVALLPGCSRPRDPQAAFDHARETLRKGDTAAAASEAERGYREFHATGPGWAWK